MGGSMNTQPRPLALIADDARVMRMLVRTWLERLGCDVVEAASGSEVLGVLTAPDSPTFACAFFDIHMPGVTGLHLVETMRQHPRWRLTPVVIVTTLGHAADVERGLRLGATAYLTKPLGFADLARALSQALPERFAAR